MQTFNFSKTLFVCTGNVYRSYISEQVLRGICDKFGKNDITCWSRGTELYYKSPHPDIIKYCTSVCDYDFSANHTPELINTEDAQAASIIIGFTQSHIDCILAKFPGVSGKIVLFSDIFNSTTETTQDILYDDVSITNSTLQFNILSIIQAIENKFMPNNVSVIIPVHNEIKNIGSLIEQLSQQLFKGDEIIVISSGSHDGTDEIIESIIKNANDSVKLIKQKNREGKVSALKQGLNLAKNKTLILIDGDIRISKTFRNSIKQLSTDACYTGKISVEIISSNFINRVSYVSTAAWNNLRSLLNNTGKFLYPSGYCMVIPRRYLQYALTRVDNAVVNDDANIAIELFKKKVLFNYISETNVFVKFPQKWNDFLIQKIRTRLGRQQKKSIQYSMIEKYWRQQVVLFLNTKYALAVIILLAVDFICRIIAKIKLLSGKNHHIWIMIKSSK